MERERGGGEKSQFTNMQDVIGSFNDLMNFVMYFLPSYKHSMPLLPYVNSTVCSVKVNNFQS